MFLKKKILILTVSHKKRYILNKKKKTKKNKKKKPTIDKQISIWCRIVDRESNKNVHQKEKVIRMRNERYKQ